MPTPASKPRNRRVARCCALSARFDLSLSGVEELVLEGVEILLVSGGAPLECRRQPRSAVQLTVVASALGPVARCVREMTHDAKPLTILVEPRPKAGPLADQRFVRDLDGPLRDRHQAGRDERVEHNLGPLGAGCRLAGEFFERGPPPSVLGAVTELGEAEEHRPNDALLIRIQRLVDRVRSAGDRTADTAARTVPRHGQRAAVSALPHLQQGVRQQGQTARLAGHIAKDQIGEPWLERQAGDARWTFDRIAQTGLVHRADQQ